MKKYWINGLCGLLVGTLLAACAAPLEPALDSTATAVTAQQNPPGGQPRPSAGPLATAAPTDAVAAAFATPTLQPGATSLPPATALPGGKPAVPASPVVGLQQALLLADQEMQAAQASATLVEARHHAEGAANILVGYWGLWYGDADGDGTLYDPSNGQGVLPAGRVQESANGSETVRTQLGWALILFLDGTPAHASVATQLLGDPRAWQNDAPSQYAAIQRAVEGSDDRGNLVQKLPGQVEQSLGWARLILLRASTVAEAHAFAAQGAAVTAEMVRASQSIH